VKNFLAFLVFAAASVFLGIVSARGMIENGFSLAVGHAGPWQTWVRAGAASADPYTRAHFARTGELPITSASGLSLFAHTDDDGDRLVSECEYEITVQSMNAVWWTIALYDSNGQLIPNKANRYAFSSKNLTIRPDGTQRITMAPNARPGYWLPSGEDHDLTLLFHIIRPLSLEQQQSKQATAPRDLPRIRKIGC
jgi:hypothetical protein